MSEQSSAPADPSRPSKLVFHYIKSNFFRVVFADGFIAGPQVAGGIHLEAYNTRTTIPERVTHELSEKGLGPEIEAERITKRDLIREVECEIIMPLDTAKQLAQLLTARVEMLENEIRKAQGKPASEEPSHAG